MVSGKKTNITEQEGFGVTYERYALIKLQEKITANLNIKNVVEIPAHGAKAAPSLYSIGFGLNKVKTTLINGESYMLRYWKKLKIEKYVDFKKEKSLYKTSFKENTFDLAWNFAYLQIAQKPVPLLKEMIRISKKYVMITSVNNFNPGFWVHNTLHKIKKVPWTHGDRSLNYCFKVKKIFSKLGLKNVSIGLVDCPPWPDSLGFRDMRLHKYPKKVTVEQWDPDIIEIIHNNAIPKWMRLCYTFESLPLPKFIKIFYTHIFYVIGEK